MDITLEMLQSMTFEQKRIMVYNFFQKVIGDCNTAGYPPPMMPPDLLQMNETQLMAAFSMLGLHSEGLHAHLNMMNANMDQMAASVGLCFRCETQNNSRFYSEQNRFYCHGCNSWL